MKLLFVCEFFPAGRDLKFSGGVESYSYHLIKELSRKNQVTVITTKLSSEAEDLTNKNLRVIRVGLKIKNIESNFSSLPKRLIFQLTAIQAGLKQDFDLVQGDNFVSHLPAFLIGFLKNKPRIAFYADVFIGKWSKISGHFAGAFGELSERINLSLPWTKIIALSLTTKEKLKNQNIPDNKMEVIYGGVDLEFFQGIQVKKYSELTVLYVGRLVNYKNVDTLIKAIGILKEKKQKVNLTIVGAGLEKESLQALVENLNLAQQVIFKENLSRDELAKEFKKSHLFVLPSNEEGFGLVIIEAAASGVPYIVSDIPVLREVTRNGLGGMLFKLKDQTDLAEKIEKYLKDSKLRERLKGETQALAKSYQWEEIAKQYETVYQDLNKKKLKILMLVDAWFPHYGGGQVHVWELSKKLTDLGVNISIYTRDLGNWSEKYPGVTVKKVGYFKKFPNLLGRVEYLTRALIHSLTSEYDILHAHAFSPGLLVPIIKFFRNKKVVFTVHGRGDKVAGLNGSYKWLEEVVLFKVNYDLEITVAASSLDKKTGAKREIFLPNGIDIDKFSASRRVRKKIKNVVYIGRLSYEKGIDLLISAINEIRNQDLNLFIIGSGPEKESLQNMRSKAQFLGKLEGHELHVWFKKADLLVIPSRTEGHPLVLFEAWASELPVLATRVGDNEVYIKDSVTGFLCNPDIEDISKKILSIIENNKLEVITRNAYSEVTKYSWDKIAKETYREYLKLTYG